MVEQMVKVVEERGRVTRGGPYVYVVEGDELVHISEYAAKNWNMKTKQFTKFQGAN